MNHVTCHAGFTLNDLISYDRKHNEANGEENRDGADDNGSRNWGAEGPARAVDDDRLAALANPYRTGLWVLRVRPATP